MPSLDTVIFVSKWTGQTETLTIDQTIQILERVAEHKRSHPSSEQPSNTSKRGTSSGPSKDFATDADARKRSRTAPRTAEDGSRRATYTRRKNSAQSAPNAPSTEEKPS